MAITSILVDTIYLVSLSGFLNAQAQDVVKASQEPRARVIFKSEKELQDTATHKVLPVYPPLAKKSSIDPTVVLAVTIDEEGMVDDAQIRSGEPLLYDAAWEAIYEWEWEPTVVDGKPVRVAGLITLHFQMQGSIPDSGDIERYKKLVLNKPDSPLGYKLLGRAYARVGRYDDAVETFRKLVQLKPDTESLYTLGKYYALLGDNNRAIESYSQAIKIDPKHTRSLHAVAQSYSRMERYDEALSAYGDIIRRDPKYSGLGKVYEEIGWILTERDQDAEALDAYLKSVEISPGEDVYIRALTLFQKLKRDEETGQFAKQALSDHPDFQKFRLALAETYLQSRRFDDAIHLYLDALKSDSNNELMYEALGRAYQMQKNYDEAINALKKALQLKPGSGSLYFIHLSLADAYMNLKRYPEAIESARDAVQADPKISRGYLALGSLLEKVHRSSEAEPMYLKALEVDPDDPVVLNNVSYFFFDQNKKLDEGLQMIQKALKQQPTNAHFLDTMGYGYFKVKKFNEAERYITDAARRNPNSGLVQEHLGDLHHIRGREQLAQEAWRRALSLSMSKDDDLTARLKLKLAGQER